MWAPLLEKAWAKITGNYIQSDGGLPTNTIHALAGIPVFKYIFNKKLVYKNLF